MNRLDRALGILLMLRSGKTVSAAELARRFEVSSRTVYRDIETLSAVGVPVYAEMGRQGGFRLAEGYFLPPIMFSSSEATALLVGVAMLKRLRVTPFAAPIETAIQKLRAALPESTRSVLERAEQVIGFEAIPSDLLHPERTSTGERQLPVMPEAQVLESFLQAIFDSIILLLRYQSPDAPTPIEVELIPHGLIWDRDRWYLVGERAGRSGAPHLWRADRVLSLRRRQPSPEPIQIDARSLLGRRWLDAAMQHWNADAPVILAITEEQATRLKTDWYYGHAVFGTLPDGRRSIMFGDDDPAVVLTLLRWLGPGAELIEPHAWRPLLRAELLAMLAPYQSE